MNALGAAALIAALATALYAGVAALLGTRGDSRWVDSSRRAIYALCGLLAISVIALQVAFLSSDLSLKLVSDHSSTTTPTLYRATAMWGSQAGSLLFWAFLLSIAASAVLLATRGKLRELVPWATAVIAGVAVFFCGLMVVGIAIPAADSWPFARLDPAPAEGAGLNPLLRHWAMAMHPPMLYSGYVFFTIPFAFAIGALAARRVDASWIRATRRFALIAWTFLTIGLALGALWSYWELGWGGYWAWDPVENAALMPWLTGTAFLHSIMVQERRGMLRVWNASLIVVTFALVLLGTFLVRSGVLQSIHAFGESEVGLPLLGLIAVVLLGSTLLIISRLGDLRSPRRIDSLLSREAFFLVNNLLLVGLAAVVFWGTFFPLISEAATGERSTLAAPWFDRYTTPIGIGLLLAAGIGPLLAWRRISLDWMRRAFVIPIGAAIVAGALLASFAGVASRPLALALFMVAAFTLVAVGQELWRGAGARRSTEGGSWPAALAALVTRNRRRYGGYVVHAGVAVMLIGVAASSSFQTSRDLRLLPGEQATVGDYTVRYERPISGVDGREQKLILGAMLVVSRDGERVTTLTPSREYYSTRAGDPSEPLRSFFEGEATSEVSQDGRPTRDLWAAMQPDLSGFDRAIERGDRIFSRLASRAEPGDLQAQAQLAQLQGAVINGFRERYQEQTPPADIRFNVNPFVLWLWVGVLVAVGGALLALWPGGRARRRVSNVYAARLARELSRA